MLLIQGQTFAEVYRIILDELLYRPEYKTMPRGLLTHEVTNCIIEIKDPSSNLFINEVRSTPRRYLAGELYWYFSGSNLVEQILPYSTFWKALVNPDGKTVNSAYGHLLFREQYAAFNEWQWALSPLLKDRDSRQAIIRFNKPWHSYEGVKDFVCTLTGIFNIRDDKLNLTIIMRSQDEVLGRTFDIPFFTLLQQQMLSHLKIKYPELTLGKYVQHNISTHLYERDFEKVKRMLEHPFIPDGLPRLDKDLIWPDGKFKLQNFSKDNDLLISWINRYMGEET